MAGSCWEKTSIFLTHEVETFAGQQAEQVFGEKNSIGVWRSRDAERESSGFLRYSLTSTVIWENSAILPILCNHKKACPP